MPNTFFISDTHFSHANILTFKRDDGSPLRNFTSIEDHDDHICEQWNKTVRPSDHIYHLGDVVINRRYLSIISKLNGHKRLVRGNHDIFKTAEYLPYFEEIYGVRVFDNLLFSHIPIHPQSLSRFKGNVHGHLHDRSVLKEPDDIWGEYLPDPRYLCVSCEQVNYTPVSLDEVRAHYEK